MGSGDGEGKKGFHRQVSFRSDDSQNTPSKYASDDEGPVGLITRSQGGKSGDLDTVYGPVAFGDDVCLYHA